MAPKSLVAVELAALREGYRRFGDAPFLVKQVLAVEPVVYL